MKRGKADEREHGALIIEATISLSIFMFAMFMFLSLIQIAYTQARMSVALTTATKQVAEYAHIYYATGMNEALSGSGGMSSEAAGELGEFLQNMGGSMGSIDSELGQYVTDAGTAMSHTSLADLGKGALGQTLVLQMMKQNLVADSADSPEAFMRRNHVEGLDMMESSVLEGGSGDIFMRAKYKVNVVKLLNLDYGFQMSSWAYAKAWGS